MRNWSLRDCRGRPRDPPGLSREMATHRQMKLFDDATLDASWRNAWRSYPVRPSSFGRRAAVPVAF